MYAQAHKRRAEYCELLYDETGLWVSQSTMCRTFQRLELPRKKNAPPQPSQKCPKGYRFA